MRRQQTERLWDKFLEGDLTAEEDKALTSALERDPALREELLDELELANLLPHVPTSTEEFVRSFRARLSAPAEQAKMVRGVRARLHEKTPGRGASAIARRPAAWGWGITALAASILLLFGWVLQDRLSDFSRLDAQPPLVVQRVAGQAVVVSAYGARSPARPMQPLQPGQTLATDGANSWASLTAPGTTVLDLSGDTALRLQAPTTLLLERGTLSADVGKLPDRTWTFNTPHAEILVLGTRFSVHVTEQTTRVEMERGQVRVRDLATNRSAVLTEGSYAVLGAHVHMGGLASSRETYTTPLALRRRSGLQVLYEFCEGSGPIVHDVAGVGLPLNLRVQDPSAVAWRAPGRLATERSTVITVKRPASKLIEACTASDELSIEAWVTPANTTQGAVLPNAPMRILTLIPPPHGGGGAFDLGQHGSRYEIRLRLSNEAGSKMIVRGTPRGTVQTARTHIVFTRDAGGRTQMYLNGQEQPFHWFEEYAKWVKQRDKNSSGLEPVRNDGTFADWSRNAVLALANSPNRPDHERPWLGELHLIAIYNRFLTPETVARLYNAGVDCSAGQEQAFKAP